MIQQHLTTADPFEKTITYDRVSHDYAAYLDDRYIGNFPTYLAAETALNQIAYDLLRDEAIITADNAAERAERESTEAPLLVEPSTVSYCDFCESNPPAYTVRTRGMVHQVCESCFDELFESNDYNTAPWEADPIAQPAAQTCLLCGQPGHSAENCPWLARTAAGVAERLDDALLKLDLQSRNVGYCLAYGLLPERVPAFAAPVAEAWGFDGWQEVA